MTQKHRKQKVKYLLWLFIITGPLLGVVAVAV